MSGWQGDPASPGSGDFRVSAEGPAPAVARELWSSRPASVTTATRGALVCETAISFAPPGPARLRPPPLWRPAVQTVSSCTAPRRVFRGSSRPHQVGSAAATWRASTTSIPVRPLRRGVRRAELPGQVRRGLSGRADEDRAGSSSGLDSPTNTVISGTRIYITNSGSPHRTTRHCRSGRSTSAPCSAARIRERPASPSGSHQRT
jgi:hypothetical protein